MLLALIWGTAAVCYAGFYTWYVGFRRRLSLPEVEAGCAELEKIWSKARVAPVRAFLSRDTGRDFCMVNLLKLHATTVSGERGSVVMQRYQKPFLKAIFKRACHPVAVGIAASQAVECWGLDGADHWTVGAFVRYRSRRDLLEILLTPAFGDIHPFKEEAVEKTIAFAADPSFILGGGPKLTVPLVLFALAAVMSCALA